MSYNSKYKGSEVEELLDSIGNKEDKVKVVNHGTDDTTYALTPNVFHKWGEVSNLSLSLEEYTGEDIVYYMAEFVSGSTATTLSVPDNIKWESDVTIEAEKTYQISILNNCGVIGEF